MGIFIIPFIPLYVANGMFFPFITGKNFAFRIIVEVILALWAILILRDKEYAPGKSMILYTIGAFLAVMTIADFFGANFYRSFWSNYERMEGLVALIHMCGYFLVLGSVLNTQKLWDRYFKTILGVGVLIFIYSCAQLAGLIVINQGAFRVDATFGNATYLAVHMLFLMFISVFYYFRSGEVGDKSEGNGRFVYLFLALSYFFILYKTATRGALIGLFAGVITSGLILAYFGSQKAKRASIALLGGVALAVLLFIPARNLEFVKTSQTLSRFGEINIQNLAKESRFMVWGSALKGSVEHPILGWGQDNFNIVFNKYYDPGMFAQEPWFDRAHDVFFDWLTAGGLLGLTAYLSLFAAGLYAIWKKSDRLKFTLLDKTIFTGMFAAYFIQNIFVFDNLMSYTIFFTLLAYLHYGSREVAVRHKVAEGPEDMFFMQFMASLVLVGLALTVYFVNVKPILTSRTLIRALSVQDHKQSILFFKEAFAYKTFGSVEAREQLAQRAVGIRNANIDNEIKLEYVNLAKEEMTKQINASPNDARYRIFMSSLLTSYGLQDEALVQAEKAVELSPKKQMLLFELASVYINRKEYDKALEKAKYAYDIEPNFPESARIYATIAIYAKRDKDPEIQALMMKTYGTDTPPDDRFVNAYAAVSRYDKVIEIWKKKVALDPKNAQFHISLAASYLANGQRSKAVEELRIAITISPEFKVNGEHFISEIQAGRNP